MMLTQAHIEGTSFYARIIVSGMTFPKEYGLRKEVDVNTVTVVQSFESTRKVDVQVEIGRITLMADSCQIRQQILVNIE